MGTPCQTSRPTARSDARHDPRHDWRRLHGAAVGPGRPAVRRVGARGETAYDTTFGLERSTPSSWCRSVLVTRPRLPSLPGPRLAARSRSPITPRTITLRQRRAARWADASSVARRGDRGRGARAHRFLGRVGPRGRSRPVADLPSASPTPAHGDPDDSPTDGPHAEPVGHDGPAQGRHGPGHHTVTPVPANARTIRFEAYAEKGARIEVSLSDAAHHRYDYPAQAHRSPSRHPSTGGDEQRLLQPPGPDQ